MKLSLKTLTVALAAITLSPAALADTAKDGTVHITGLIKQNACTVKTDSVEVTLQEEFASLFHCRRADGRGYRLHHRTRKLRRKRLQQCTGAL